ncbi:MAG: RNA polymerase sigma factor [Eggerthellaceae bacterium]
MLCVAISRCRPAFGLETTRRTHRRSSRCGPRRSPQRRCGTRLQDSELGRALGPSARRCLIVHLHYYEGFSTEEIARLVHCAPATVRSRLSRARTQLGKMLGKGGIL